MSFGRFVRDRRAAMGTSLRAAARALDVDPAHLSRVEAGKAPASTPLIHRLADLLGCERDVLLLLAGRLPEDIRAMVETQPLRMTSALRNTAASCAAEPRAPYGETLPAEREERAIENGFPFDRISEIAEAESWRKEIYRPVYHVHKWWAQRLGSVFRAVVLAAASPRGSSVLDLFHAPVRLPGIVVFDPFMGSGTIVGEARKLGCTVVGRDINPVACRAVHVALGSADRSKVTELFRTLDAGVGAEIRKLYRARDGDGRPCDVLYFFWVKVVRCPGCETGVDLFSKYVFATHADRKAHPHGRIVCPVCGAIVTARFDATEVTCACGSRFNPQHGPAKRTTAVCGGCRREFRIAQEIGRTGRPPDHRLYAKLVLRSDGTKEYLPASTEDFAAYAHASERLAALDPPLPGAPVGDGFNTRQILNYGYREWRQLFNDRQLLSLAMLAGAIRDLPAGPEREALGVLFSGVLEFNNMFASYKGEGTGAVRPMFSHHILKPERTPVEANPWGTPRSSGAFSTLFKSRLLRALDYRQAPFEIGLEHAGGRTLGRKVTGMSPPMGGPILWRHPAAGLKPGDTYLSCGDSARMDLPAGSVDLVVTDPPFFDNVHYSELADFFHVWQRLYFEKRPGGAWTTRRIEEVQDSDPGAFAEKLRRVFVECRRVLRDHGLLVFSYHHSREAGWAALAKAVVGAGFEFTQSHPVKAEMSVAAPKSQAREPIDLDVILVCKKRDARKCAPRAAHEALRRAVGHASRQVGRLNAAGRRLSRNDVRVVVLSRLLVDLTEGRTPKESDGALHAVLPETPRLVENVWRSQRVDRVPARENATTRQATLPLQTERELESSATPGALVP